MYDGVMKGVHIRVHIGVPIRVHIGVRIGVHIRVNKSSLINQIVTHFCVR